MFDDTFVPNDSSNTRTENPTPPPSPLGLEAWSRPQSAQDATKPTEQEKPVAANNESALDTAKKLLPEFTDTVGKQIGQNPTRQEDLLALDYLTAKDPQSRKDALDKLSGLTDANGRMRFAQINLIDKAVKIDQQGKLLDSPMLTPPQRDQANKDLVASIKDLARGLSDGTRPPGSLPGEGNAAKPDAMDNTITGVLTKLRENGKGAHVEQALQDRTVERVNERQETRDAMSRFAKADATPGDRELSLRQLADLNKKLPRRELTSSLEEMTAVDSVLRMKEAKTPSDLAQELKRLKELGDNGNSQAARLERFLKSSAGQGVMANLLDTKNEGVADRAAKTIKDLLDKPDGKAAELVTGVKVKDIFKDFPQDGKASLEQLQTARKALEGLGESPQAKDWLNWTKSEELLKKLGDPETSKKAFEELKESFRQGDQYAKTAMSKILLSDSGDLSRKWENLDSTKTALGGKPIGNLDLSGLSSEERSSLRLGTLTEMKESGVKLNGLSRSETSALGLAFQSNIDNESFKKGAQELFTGIFDRGVTAEERKTNHDRAISAAKETEQALYGLFDAMSLSDTSKPGGKAL
ncbi:MAG: hypothetical protein K2Z81_09015, partial [Cyanobacteria bacterium]|nr:hypothetical protein [Cyanobacteriota bacterium]